MEKKNSKKKSIGKWVCKHGCQNSIEPCPHLEKLLPQIPRNRVSTLSVSNMDLVMAHQPFDRQEKANNSIKTLLSGYNLLEEEMRLLESKFDQDMTLKQIAAEQGFVDKNAASYLYRKILLRLKSLGIKPRGKR